MTKKKSNKIFKIKSPQQTFTQYFKDKPNKDNNQETFINYNYERNEIEVNLMEDQDKNLGCQSNVFTNNFDSLNQNHF